MVDVMGLTKAAEFSRLVGVEFIPGISVLTGCSLPSLEQAITIIDMIKRKEIGCKRLIDIF
jgi:hypothetical protein